MNKKHIIWTVLGAVAIAGGLTGHAGAFKSISFNTSGAWGPTVQDTQGSSWVRIHGKRSGSLGASTATVDPTLNSGFACAPYNYTVTAQCFNPNTQATELQFAAWPGFISANLDPLSTPRCNSGTSYTGGYGSVGWGLFN